MSSDAASTSMKYTSVRASPDIPGKSLARWGTGWETPAKLVALYILAFAIASGHYVFFNAMDKRRVDDSALSQSHVSGISTALAFGFKAALEAAVGIAYTQQLWSLFRKRPLKGSTINALFSILTNPLNVLQPGVIRDAKVEVLFALLFWCIPVATIFPPGALTVVSAPATLNMSVPTFDSAFRGSNRSFVELERNALFELDAHFNHYLGPSHLLTSVAQRAILGGEQLVMESPCGQNCSYKLEFTGPTFDECTIVRNNTPMHLDEQTSSGSRFVAANSYCQYRAGSQKIDAEDAYSNATGGPLFQMEWIPEIEKENTTFLNCVPYYGNYTVSVTYVNGKQDIKAHVQPYRPLVNNATVSYTSPKDIYNTDYDTITVGTSNKSVDTYYVEDNLMALTATLVDALTGSVCYQSVNTPLINNTVILDTPFASYPMGTMYNDIRINITESALKEVLHNITISAISLSKATADRTPVLIENFANEYSFNRKVRFVVPYGATLLLSLLFLFLGGHALLRNGVPAEGSDFFQVACTVSGSETFRAAAAAGCLGGVNNVGEHLRDMRLQFGELRRGDDSGVPRAGFGTVDEVVPLKKGHPYGAGVLYVGSDDDN